MRAGFFADFFLAGAFLAVAFLTALRAGFAADFFFARTGDAFFATVFFAADFFVAFFVTAGVFFVDALRGFAVRGCAEADAGAETAFDAGLSTAGAGLAGAFDAAAASVSLPRSCSMMAGFSSVLRSCVMSSLRATARRRRPTQLRC